MLKNYLKLALRHLKRHKGYFFINVAGLAIGITCCILILLWVQDEISYDRFHDKKENLYRVVVSFGNRNSSSSPWALIAALKKDIPEIIQGTWYGERIFPVRFEERAHYENFGMVSQEFFEMFSFPLVKGNLRTVLSDLNSVVITERTAVKYFGNDDPMGQVIHFDNRVDLIVTGVMKDIPTNSHMQFDCLVHPVHIFGAARLRTWSADYSSYVLLHSDADVDEVNKKISGIIDKYVTSTNYQRIVSLQPFKRIHLYALNGIDPIVYVYLFSAVAAVILLIACINFMNLSTAESSKRAKEVGLRKVVGATRSIIIRQFFGESIMLSCVALLVSILLVNLLLPGFNSLASKHLTFNIFGNISIVFGLVLIALITGIVSGIYPAIFLSAFQPVVVLKKAIMRSSLGFRFRRILIVVQLTASVLLIISTAIILRQLKYIRTKDLGFNRDQIVTIRTNREMRGKYETIKQELLRNKDILRVTAASSIPLAIGNNNPVYWEGRSAEDYERMNFVCVDYDYFETFDMNMAYGRSFSRDYVTDAQNYIVNEAALKLTGYEDPIGRMFSMWTNEGEIVGVVKNFHGTSLHNEIRPIVFVLYKNLPYFYMFIKLPASDIPHAIDYVKGTLRRHVPDYLFEYTFLDETFDRQYKNEERLEKILEYFTFLAISISCLGLFGLASFMAEQRTKEIAIRKVLGATISSILTILSKEFVVLVMIANAIAWPAAYFVMRAWIQNFAYHTNIGLWLFVLAGTITLTVTLLTICLHWIRAALANPVESLRYE